MSSNDLQEPVDSAVALRGLPRVAGYRVLRRLGHGGMAMVYLAVQESLDREVAIKVMRPARHLDEAQATRFEHEARIIAKLEHPGIVVIHEVGRTLDGDLYYVMPYLARGDLAARDYRGDEAGLVALLRVLLDALGYAHARGIVHRDVKAENVLFDNADRPQLADFGIALASSPGAMRVTGDGLAIGSGATMSPEQARAATVDGRADLYSVGVLAYELLTGVLPFHADDSLALALMHANDPVPDLPADKAHWQEFVHKAMAKRPEQRFRNAQAMQRALDPIDVLVRRRARPLGRTREVLRRRGFTLALAVLLPLLLLSAGWRLWPSLSSSSSWSSASSVPVPRVATDPPRVDVDDALVAHLARTRERLAAGAVLEPAQGNAADSVLAALARDPANSAAQAMLVQVTEAARAPMIANARRGESAAFDARAALFETLASKAGPAARTAIADVRTSVAAAALDRARLQAEAHARDDAMAWLGRAARFGAAGEDFAALHTRVDGLVAAGSEWRDAGGPALRLVPPRIGTSIQPRPLYVMRDEVSRAEFAAFAKGSGREAARCRNRLSPLRLFDRRDWRDPGFAQTEAEPVICVSLDDATAYARWLSARTGKTYRLPTRAEWRHFALPASRANACAQGNVLDRAAAAASARHACSDGYAQTSPTGRFPNGTLGLRDVHGNVAEWVSGCAKSVRGRCSEHLAMGLSWRDGTGATNGERTLSSERGWDDVGFRLVREP